MPANRDVIQLPSTSADAAPELSIVVMFTHDADQAERCLSGIAKIRAELPPSETILVLNASGDAVRRLVAERSSGAQVIESPANTGTAVAWQLAFTAARGHTVLLLHEDAVPLAGMAPLLLETLAANPGAAAAGPWLSASGDAEPNNAGWLRFRDLSGIRLRPEQIPDALTEAPYAVDEISSAISLWDRAAWLEIGGFDERTYPAISVEADTFATFWAYGRSVLVEPRARGLHASGAMNDAPGLLTGPHLRHFLHTRFERFWATKWGQRADWLAQPGAEIEIALELAQARSRELTPLIADLPEPAHGLTNPDGRGEPPVAVDAEMAARLRAAEREAIDDYTRWLIARDIEMTERYEDVHAAYVELGARVEDLEARSAMLDGVLGSRWWRLRDRLKHIARRPS